MKYLLSKEPYSYGIHTLLMKSSAYPLLLQTTPLYELPPLPPPFLQENLAPPPFHDFSKISIFRGWGFKGLQNN